MIRAPSAVQVATCALTLIFICHPGAAGDPKPQAPPHETGDDPRPSFLTFSKIDKAWAYSKGKGTKVAILDWLFDMSPEAAEKYVNPTSLVPDQAIGSGEPWHGEWMAGIVHRIAPEARIIPIRARPSRDGKEHSAPGRQDYEKYLIEGIRFAADQGAVAVTNSMGPVHHGPELIAAVEYAEERGTLFVDVHPEYVVYTEKTFQKCRPDECDKRILHPGLFSVPEHPTEPEPARDLYVWPYQIDPVFKDGWGFSNGPPIVAGVLALMRSANPELSPAELREILLQTTYIKDGFEVLDAEAAVKEAAQRGSG